MKRFLFFVAISVLSSQLSAQSSQVTLNADSTATITLRMPGATKSTRVFIDGNFPSSKKHTRRGYRMTAETQNQKPETRNQKPETFTFQTGKLSPEMYVYYFSVNKQQFVDSLQPTVRDIRTRYNYFFVTDSVVSNYLSVGSLPHGSIHKVWYPSTMGGMSQRRMFIYTPAYYDSTSRQRYPVLYLLHGSGGDETSWTDYGRAAQILDHLIAQGRCKPMIVVMPNGNVELDAAPGESPYMDRLPSANNTSSMFGDVETHFVPEIVKYVDLHYPTIPDKQHRAIAGLSLGGFQTLYTSLNNPQTFDYIGLFSPQTSNKLNDKNIHKLNVTTNKLQRTNVILASIADVLPHRIDLAVNLQNISVYNNLEQKLQRQFSPAPRLYYIAIGKDDFLMTAPLLKQMNQEFFNLLDEKDYPHEFHLTTGTHSWENWRRYLVDFLPKLFY